MKSFQRFLFALFLMASVLGVSGCENAAERAERYFQSALSYLAKGDEERAAIEFRNVFQYNGFHREARMGYAGLQFKRGNLQEAYSQYLLLIEQYPDSPDVRQILAEIAISTGNWEEVERHGKAAVELAPDLPGVIAVKAALDYHNAQLAGDAAVQAAAVQAAMAVIKLEPNSIVARRVVIEALLTGPNPKSALPEIDAALLVEPEMMQLHVLKLQLLLQTENVAATGTQLETMAELFPDDERVRSGLVGWYLEQGKVDAAEAFLRAVSARISDDPTAQMNVVRLLQQARGPEAAQKELDALIEAHADKPNADVYRSLRASIDFENGRKDEAIARIRELLETAPVSDQTRSIKVMLAKMLAVTGEVAEARVQVDAVLAEDVSNVEALKMRASWLVDEDKPGDAILALRTALDQSPRDSTILMLMAIAHERDGSPELAGERLALAVEVSGAGVEESMRYVSFLLRTGNDLSAARKVLLDAFAASPTNLEVIQTLAQVLIQQSDWALAEELVTSLQQIEGLDAARIANGIRTAILLGQEKTDESIQFLQGLIDRGEGDVSSIAIIVQTRIRAGKTSEARAYLDQVIEQDPDNQGLQFLSGSLYVLMGQPKQAEATYRELLSKSPDAQPVVQALYALLREEGRAAEATQLLDGTLLLLPKSTTLRWMKATELEQALDFEAAISVYEELYAEDTANLVIANNLASLLASTRTDPESLERAYLVARRLKDNPTPAFQDTLGWIEFRRGEIDQALRSLEPAAEQLATDPQVQMHLGLAYEAAGRLDEAKEKLQLALDLAADTPIPALQAARDALARIETSAKTGP